MEKVLVTGAAGFIGSKLTEELIRRGFEVYALIEKGDSRSKRILTDISSTIVVVDDLKELLKTENTPQFDKIFHLATVGVRPDFNHIELICDVNIKMGCQLVDFAKSNGTKLLINFGSCFEYGDHGDVLLKENMVCRPESLYAISKNASTNLMSCYAKQQQVNLITVRPFGVFGEGEGPNRLAPSIIKNCLAGNVVKTTLGEQVRDFVNVKDLVKAIIELSVSDYQVYEIYNICSDNPVRVKSFIEEIVEICGFDKSLISFGAIPYRTNEAMVFAGSNKKLQAVINYPFPNDHKDGILDIYRSMKGDV